MGRASGIEVRPRSIRFTFLPGKPTLRVNGEPLAPTPPNLKYAHRLAAEIRQKQALGTFSMAEYFPVDGMPGHTTTGQALESWLAAQRVAPSTRRGYSSAVRFWSESLGLKPVRALKHSEVLAVLAARPTLSGKTVNNYVSVIHQALALAVRDGLASSNAAESVPRADWQRKEADPFSVDEVETIIAGSGEVRNMVEFWLFTGLRTSELAGLRWEQVDLQSGYVRIDRALVRGEEKGSTKTGVSRDVRLNSRALAAIQRQRAVSGLAGEHVWLDPRTSAAWLNERYFEKYHWRPILKRLGVRYRRPYNCRHTYATMMLMAGRTPAWCARQLGHSVEVFLRTYARWIAGEQDDRELDGLERWLKEGQA